MHQQVSQHLNEDTEHEKIAVRLYFLGLILFLAAWLIKTPFLWLNDLGYVAATLTAGYHVMWEGFGETLTALRQKKRFAPNIHILMTLAAVGAILIGSFEEAALLILIFAGAHFLEDYAEGKSKREITKLLKMNPTEARLLQADGRTKIVPVAQLVIGDQVQVLNGGQVPTDGRILSGSTAIDESSITGESIPREKTVGDEVFGSTINGNGTFLMTVTKDSSETVFAKILQLVDQSQNNLTKAATKIKKIEPIYVQVVLYLFPLVVLAGPLLLGWSWSLSLYRGMVFLISASPCALAASAVPATLSGISNLAKRGVLFKGGAYLANLSDLKAICFDKTGTLTAGKPVVTDAEFFGLTVPEQQQLLAVVTAMERRTNHPLATAIVAKYGEQVPDLPLTANNQVGQGLTATYQGLSYRIAKPSVFAQVPLPIEQRQDQLAQAGKTVVYLEKNEVIVGLLALMDVPNENSRAAIAYFKRQHVHTTMITGDARLTGQAVADQLQIDQVIANVLPEDKSSIIAQQQTEYGLVGMVGDGVNDAPALVKADVGVAMGDGTDVAIDVADVVLMQNDLAKLSYAHQTSQRLNRVVMQNMIFSMVIVLILVTLNFLGQMDIALGVIAHEGSTLLVIVNGLRLLLPSRIRA
nr:heavy metal translocating P-type ATPase [Lapidilactobacillus luobeiensis]